MYNISIFHEPVEDCRHGILIADIQDTWRTEKMINPVDYMSRLKMPAMMTDTEGGVIFANAAAKRLLTLKCRRRLFSSLVGISGEKLAETCLRKRGAVVTTGAGAGGIRMLVLGGEDSLRWYFPQVLARAS